MSWSSTPPKNQLRSSERVSNILPTQKDKLIFPTTLGGDRFLVANDWTEKCSRLKKTGTICTITIFGQKVKYHLI